MACFIFLLKTRLIPESRKIGIASFGSLKLQIWILQNQHRICKTVNQGCERETDRWDPLTHGTHATERQRHGRRSSLAKLDDGDVSVGSKGIYVFHSSRRTQRPTLPALYWTLGCSPLWMAARRRCGRYTGGSRQRRRGRACGRARGLKKKL